MDLHSISMISAAKFDWKEYQPPLLESLLSSFSSPQRPSAAAIGGGLVCIGFGFSDQLLSLEASATRCIRVTAEGLWQANNHSGWFRVPTITAQSCGAGGVGAETNWRRWSSDNPGEARPAAQQLSAVLQPQHAHTPPPPCQHRACARWMPSCIVSAEKFRAEVSARLGPCLAAARCLCPPTAAGLYLRPSEPRQHSWCASWSGSTYSKQLAFVLHISDITYNS